MEGFFDGQPFGFTFGNRPRPASAPGWAGPPDPPDPPERIEHVGWDPTCPSCTAPGQCPVHHLDDPVLRDRAAATGSPSTRSTR